MIVIDSCAIRLDGLRFYAYHGVLPQERNVGGHYTVDLCLTLTDAGDAIENDILDGTVNYAEVYDVVQREMNVPSALLEHVAGRIVRALFDAFPRIGTATVTVRKDNPPMGADSNGCAVTITAHNEDMTYDK